MMRRLFFRVTAFVLILSLADCGGGGGLNLDYQSSVISDPIESDFSDDTNIAAAGGDADAEITGSIDDSLEFIFSDDEYSSTEREFREVAAEIEAMDPDLVNPDRDYEQLEHEKYESIGDLTLPTPVGGDDDGIQPTKNNDPLVLRAANYVMMRVNEAKQRCKQPTFDSVTVTHAVDEPGMGTQYMMEIHLKSKTTEEVYQVSVHHLLHFEKGEIIDKKTGRAKGVLDYRIRTIKPNPCKYRQLAQTFLEVNLRKGKSWDSVVYPRFFGKTVDHASQMYFGSVEPKNEDLDPGVLLQIDPASVRNFSAPRSYDFDHQNPLCLATRDIADQGNCASCYAFASATVIGARIYRATNGSVNVKLSTDEIQDCTNTCQGGSAAIVFKKLTKTSISEEWCLPDRSLTTAYPGQARQAVIPGQGYCGAQCIASTKSQSAKWSIAKYIKLDTSNLDPASRVKSIQKEILKRGPIYLSINITEEFMSYKQGILVPSKTAEVIGSHAVVLVGWGIDKAKISYWIVHNSWSSLWGVNGKVYIEAGQDHLGIETKGLWFPVVNTLPSNSVKNCTNFGSCKNGGSMDESCSCRCQMPFTGKTCEECLAKKYGNPYQQVGQACVFYCGCAGNYGLSDPCAPKQCQCCGDVERNVEGACRLTKGLTMDLGKSDYYTLYWNVASQIGSYCYIANANGTDIGIRMNLCGTVDQWTENVSRCPDRGSATFSANDTAAINRLGSGYTMKCMEFLGMNENRVNRGFKLFYEAPIDRNRGVSERSQQQWYDNFYIAGWFQVFSDAKTAAEKAKQLQSTYPVDKYGNLYYADAGSNLFLVTIDGGNKVIVNSNGQRVVAGKDGNLYALNHEVQMSIGINGKWFALDQSKNRIEVDQVKGRIVVGRNGKRVTTADLVPIGTDKNLFKLNSLGDGDIYEVSADDKTLISISKDGNRLSVGNAGAPLFLNKDGNLYFTWKDGKVFTGNDGNFFTYSQDGSSYSFGGN